VALEWRRVRVLVEVSLCSPSGMHDEMKDVERRVIGVVIYLIGN